MERIVSAYLDMAEVQAQRHIPMTMADWEERLNGFLTLWNRDILKDAGKISAELAKIHDETDFEKYRIVQDRLYKSDFDRFMLENQGKIKWRIVAVTILILYISDKFSIPTYNQTD